MDAAIKEKIQQLLQVNQNLKAENIALKEELKACAESVKGVFGAIMNKSGKGISMQKAIKLINTPNEFEGSIEKLMEIVNRNHG